MTMTDVRPDAGAPAPAAAPEPPETWFTTGDHKKLGLLFLGMALLFLLVGGVLALLLRAHLAEPSSDILGSQYGRVFSAHAAIMTLLFLTPAWIGLASYMLPLQIGSGRLAFPRVMSAAFWGYFFGGVLLVISYISGPTGGLGYTDPAAPVVNGPANRPTVLWVAAMIVIAVCALAAYITLLVTAIGLRTDGMTMLRMPAFSWATMLTSGVAVLSTPIFIGGLALVLVDQKYGAGFFQARGADAVWLHTVWLFGRPEIFLLAIPGLGAASDIIATHSRHVLQRHAVALIAIAATAVLAMTTWMSGTYVATAVVIPTYTVATALIGLPVLVLVLVWLNTARLGRAPAHISVLFVVGFLLLLLTAAANAVGAAVDGISAPSAWTTGNLHVLVFGAPTLLLFGSIYHWAPKLWGRTLGQGLGAIVFLLLFGGFFINGMASYILGYQGAPAHVDDMADKFQNMNRLAAAGGVLVILGVVVFLVDLIMHAVRSGSAAAEDDPYDGLTLEWATTSPPPDFDFESVPEVRSAAPLLDLREAELAGGPR